MMTKQNFRRKKKTFTAVSFLSLFWKKFFDLFGSLDYIALCKLMNILLFLFIKQAQTVVGRAFHMYSKPLRKIEAPLEYTLV